MLWPLGGASTGFKAPSRKAWARMGDAWRGRAGEDARIGEAARLHLASDRAPPATLEAPHGAAAESTMATASCYNGRRVPPRGERAVAARWLRKLSLVGPAGGMRLRPYSELEGSLSAGNPRDGGIQRVASRAALNCLQEPPLLTRHGDTSEGRVGGVARTEGSFPLTPPPANVSP